MPARGTPAPRSHRTSSLGAASRAASKMRVHSAAHAAFATSVAPGSAGVDHAPPSRPVVNTAKHARDTSARVAASMDAIASMPALQSGPRESMPIEAPRGAAATLAPAEAPAGALAEVAMRDAMLHATPYFGIALPRRRCIMSATFAHVTAELTAVLAGVNATNLHTSRRQVFHLLTEAAAVMKLAARVRGVDVPVLFFPLFVSPLSACSPLPDPLRSAFHPVTALHHDFRPVLVVSRALSCGACAELVQAEVCVVQDALERLLFMVLEAELKLVSIPVQTALADCFTGLFEWGDGRKLSETVAKLLTAAAKKGIDCGCRVYVPRRPRTIASTGLHWWPPFCRYVVIFVYLHSLLTARRCSSSASSTRATAGSCR